MKNKKGNLGYILLFTIIVIVLIYIIIMNLGKPNKDFNTLNCNELKNIDTYCDGTQFLIFCLPYGHWKEKIDVLERRMELGCFEDENT